MGLCPLFSYTSPDDDVGNYSRDLYFDLSLFQRQLVERGIAVLNEEIGREGFVERRSLNLCARRPRRQCGKGKSGDRNLLVQEFHASGIANADATTTGHAIAFPMRAINTVIISL